MEAGLNDLIAMAFRRGSDVELADMERTPRFREHLATLGTHPFPHDAARIQMLGEQLVQAAGDCLPERIQKLARRWRRATAEQQLRILKTVGAELTSANWYKIRDREWEETRQCDSDVLPHEFGSWDNGPIIPCCVGMATLLTGFARMAGAPHLLAQVLRARVLEVHSLDLELRTLVVKFLHDALPTLAASGGLVDQVAKLRQVEENVAQLQNFNFHPATIIQLRDGRWVLFDSYFETRVVLNEDEFPINDTRDQLTTLMPGRVGLVASRRALSGQIKQINSYSGPLTATIRAILRDVASEPYGARSLVLAVRLLEQMSADGMPLDFLRLLITHVPDLEAQGLFDPAVTPDPSVADIHEAWARLDTDPQYAQLVVERLMLYICRMWYAGVLAELRDLQQTMPPVSIEVALPDMAIAVTVLNNLRCYYEGGEPFVIGGLLARFYNSQTIWHDSVLAIRSEDGAVPDDVARTLREREDALRGLESPNFLHPHVAQLLAELTP